MVRYCKGKIQHGHALLPRKTSLTNVQISRRKVIDNLEKLMSDCVKEFVSQFDHCEYDGSLDTPVEYDRSSDKYKAMKLRYGRVRSDLSFDTQVENFKTVAADLFAKRPSYFCYKCDCPTQYDLPQHVCPEY